MNVTLTVEQSGLRADQYLAGVLDGLTRSAAQKLLEEGRVLRRGKALKKNDKLQAGDEVAVCIPDPTPVEIVPQDIPLDVVYEDGDVIVVNKPVGMVLHPAPGHPDGTLANALLYHCGQSLSGINGQPHRPGHQRPHHRRQERRSPPGPGRAAPGPQPVSGIRGRGGGQPPGGQRDGRPAHRPAPHRPEEDGGQSLERPPGRDPLDGAGPVSGVHPHPVPPGDRQDPPDPRAHGCAGSPRVGGPGVRWATQGLSWAGWAVSARPAADLPASPDGGAGHRILPAAGLFSSRLDKMRPPSIK